MVLKIYGEVQGVFFRESSVQKAKELGLVGFIRNEPDETVGIIAEGEEGKLKELIVWCKEGPKYANVDKVEEEWMKPTDEFQGFKIKVL